MKKGSGLVWLAVALVVVTVLAVGGYFGFTWLMDARGKTAVEAAAAFDEAMWAHDASGVEELLPPEFASAMTEADLAALSNWWRGWEIEDTEWNAEGIDAIFVAVAVEGQPASGEMDARYELSSDPSLSEAQVDVTYTVMAPEGEDEPADENASVDLVWLEGEWRIAAISFEGDYAFEYRFYREGKDADRLVDALRKDLGVEADPGESDSGTSESGDANALEDATKVVTDFHEALVRSDYEAAYLLLPGDKRVAFGNADAFAAQVGAYGITGYRITESSIDGAFEEAVVSAVMETANGDFGYIWRLELQGGSWVAVSREIAGMEDSTSGSAPLTPEQLENGELPSGHPDLGASGD